MLLLYGGNASGAITSLRNSLSLIIGAFLIIALLELFSPAREPARGRWALNIGLGTLNLVLVRLASVAGPFAMASLAAQEGFGLFNQLALPGWAATLFVIIAMDFAIYWQHRASHRFGWFWALHKLHHADADFDITTGLRFHPGEALLSMLYKGAVGALLGAPPEAMLLFEVYIAVGSMIEHGNIAMPPRLERVIRSVWVTPAMHTVHHSATGDDHNHNFSFALSLWDRLFGTYRAEGNGTQIGLPQAG
jgi:sterol desaturase/sphingolipid hydroxylase (fatty acid hydroxylase superfamily)